MSSISRPLSKIQNLNRNARSAAPSSARTFSLYEKRDGTFSPHWQYFGTPTAIRTVAHNGGGAYPPLWPDVVVRATSARQACALANNGSRSSQHAHGLGICWDRTHDAERTHAPLSADTATRWVVVIDCDEREVWEGEAEDGSDLMPIVENACCTRCEGTHHLLRLTQAEIRRLQPGSGGHVSENDCVLLALRGQPAPLQRL